jgi:hypothetical protein
MQARDGCGCSFMATWTQDQMIQMLRGPLRSWYRKRSLDAFPWEDWKV